MSSEQKESKHELEPFDDDEDDMTMRELPTLGATELGADNFNSSAATMIGAAEVQGANRPPVPFDASGLHEVGEEQIVGDGATTVQDLAALEKQLLERHSLFSGKTAQIAVEPQTEAPDVNLSPDIDASPVDGEDHGDNIDAPVARTAVTFEPPLESLAPMPVSGVHHVAGFAEEQGGPTHHPVLSETNESPDDVTDLLGASSSAGALASSEETPAAAPQPPLPAADQTVPVTPTHRNAKAIHDDVGGIQIKRWQVTPSQKVPPIVPAAVPAAVPPAATRLTTILFDDDAPEPETQQAPQSAQWSQDAPVGDADAALANSYLGAALEDIDALLPLGQELSAEARRLFQGGLMGLAQKLRRARALLPGLDDDAE